jgi:hypothetical protein
MTRSVPSNTRQELDRVELAVREAAVDLADIDGLTTLDVIRILLDAADRLFSLQQCLPETRRHRATEVVYGAVRRCQTACSRSDSWVVPERSMNGQSSPSVFRRNKGRSRQIAKSPGTDGDAHRAGHMLAPSKSGVALGATDTVFGSADGVGLVRAVDPTDGTCSTRPTLFVDPLQHDRFFTHLGLETSSEDRDEAPCATRC